MQTMFYSHPKVDCATLRYFTATNTVGTPRSRGSGTATGGAGGGHESVSSRVEQPCGSLSAVVLDAGPLLPRRP